MTEAIWSRRIARDEVPEEGLRVDLSADSTVRAALAQAAGLRDLPRLEANFEIARKGREGLHVTGEVVATVGQNCVVTLDPVETNLAEPIDLVFTPDAGAAGDADHEASVELSESEPPEPLVGGTIDLGAIATEYFLLGIDPYPRKEGAVFDAPPAGDPTPGAFAALAALKKASRDRGD